jgi:ATP-dependent exoDNAse (exonuclease V) beta subunit
MTRAQDRLWVCVEKPKTDDLKKPFKDACTLLAAFLQEKGEWDETQALYRFGDTDASKEATPETSGPDTYRPPTVGVSTRSDRVAVKRHHRLLWSDDKVQKIDYGLLIHELLANIRTADDLPKALDHYRRQGDLDKRAAQQVEQRIRRVLEHPELKRWYRDGLRVINERPLYRNGEILKPDRVVVDPGSGEAAIIDYKTGDAHTSHRKQIQTYAEALQQVEVADPALYLVYLKEEPEIETVT